MVVSTEIAVSVKDVTKEFLLPHLQQRRIKGMFLEMFKRRETIEHQQVLKGVSFDIRKGEFFGIVGRNGSGKSTLLKILADVYRPTSGTIEHHGVIVPMIELGVGFNMELSGRDNVYLNGALMGFSNDELDAMYEDIVEFAGLERFMDQKLKNYSSGMQVRLGFSMATRSRPDILIVDEVLAVGDAEFQEKSAKYFEDIQESGTTVILVTHSMEAMQQYCNRAVCIEQGEIIAEGDPQVVAEAYANLFRH